jgi:hypothetical protein
VGTERQRQLAWEERWSRPAGLASLAGVALAVASVVIASQAVGTSDGSSELLRNVDANTGGQMASAVIQAIGLALLAVPLYFLFRAAAARAEAMRGQLVGVVVAAPLFLAVSAVLFAAVIAGAASDFVADDVPRLEQRGVALNGDRADERADDAIGEESLSPLAAGFEIGGRIGFVVAMFYTALYAMRTGLLTRFWGSLGVALGAVSILPPFRAFVMLWFFYLGLLLAGWTPGAKPPAWRSGEAEPWPSPGDRAAEELAGRQEPAEPEAEAKP